MTSFRFIDSPSSSLKWPFPPTLVPLFFERSASETLLGWSFSQLWNVHNGLEFPTRSLPDESCDLWVFWRIRDNERLRQRDGCARLRSTIRAEKTGCGATGRAGETEQGI
jgi:hypothetical protein